MLCWRNRWEVLSSLQHFSKNTLGFKDDDDEMTHSFMQLSLCLVEHFNLKEITTLYEKRLIKHTWMLSSHDVHL